MPRYIVCLMYLVILAVAAPGCDTLGTLMSAAPTPTAEVRGVRLENLTLDGATLRFDVDVSNPYGVPLPLAGIDYALGSGAATLVSGRADLGGTIAPGATSTIELPAAVRFADVMSIMDGVRPGTMLPYTMRATLSADAPGVGPVALPLARDGELPVPAVPEVAVEGVRWTRLTLQDAEAVMDLSVLNTNQFPLDLRQLSYDLALFGRPVATAQVRDPASFAPGAARSLSIPLSFRPSDLGFAVFDMLQGREGAYRITGSLAGDTPFGPLELPFEREGATVFKR